MIDLEQSLPALVDLAPAPPPLASVARRARQRRRHRRTIAVAAATSVLAAGAIGALAAGSARHAPHLATVAPPTVDHVRVTMLDGSQLEISGPPSLGLTNLEPAFNGALGPVAVPGSRPPAHGFSVGHNPPTDLGAVVGRYRTHDGHELVVHTSSFGVTAAVQYGDWWLSATWSDSPSAQWTAFASELNAKESADGYLVVEPTDPSWQVGPTDAPDAQLGGDAYGSGASFAFFGPRTYPAGCPTGDAERHTSQGWPVSTENGAWWCDPDAKVRVAVWDQHLVDAALTGLRVAYTSATAAVDRITTLDGSTFDVTAPSSVLDQLSLQGGVWVDGLDSPNVLNETPNILPVDVRRGALPAGASEPSLPTADGHRFFSYHLPTECDCDVLAATYGEWLVEIEVERSGGTQTMSVADRARVASLFGAHETADGFLVIDPTAPMHRSAGGAGGADIVLDGLDMYTPATQACSPPGSVDAHTPEGFPVHFFGSDKATWCDPNAHVSVDILSGGTRALVDEVRVRRIP